MARITRRLKRPLNRVAGANRDASLIVVATEGSITEKIYFEEFRFTNLQIKVIPSQGGKSSPNHIFENVETFKQKYELGQGDQLWIVIDVDRWPKATLSEVSKNARQKNINLAVSNPCFELWLALHFVDNLPDPISPSSLNSHLRTALGSYSKTKYDAAQFVDTIDTAIERAEELDIAAKDRWPQSTGTHCYKLAKVILKGKKAA
jgi:hypothetical protein